MKVVVHIFYKNILIGSVKSMYCNRFNQPIHIKFTGYIVCLNIFFYLNTLNINLSLISTDFRKFGAQKNHLIEQKVVLRIYL